MKTIRAYKTELALNRREETLCRQHAGAARFAYNWGLAQKTEAYQNGQKVPSAIDLHKELNKLKKGELGWLYTVSKTTPKEALRNLDRAFANFFSQLKKRKAGNHAGKAGFPRFKSKKNGIGSFQLWGAIHVFDRSIQLPRFGRVRLKEHGYLPTSGVRILSATVSERAGRWFVSIQCEEELYDLQSDPTKPVCGVDLGVPSLATVSDGTRFENPKALRSALKKIKRLSRILSRREKGSANRSKAGRKLAAAYARTANIRSNALHQVTTWLAKNKSVIVLEDLNVAGLMKNRKLAQAFADVGLGEFRRQLEYKAAWYGSQVILAERFYASSKICSRCGHKKDDLALSERVYRCAVCGHEQDRDRNAAINLCNLALEETTASSAGSYACREDVRPVARQADLDEAGTNRQFDPVARFA